MKSGAELVKAIQPIAGLLSQSLDTNSQFYQFLESITGYSAYKGFLKQLTLEMQNALLFKRNGCFKDKKGLTKNLFAEYLDAIQELNAGNPTKLINLFKEPIAQNIVMVLNKHLTSLTAISEDFGSYVDFGNRLQSPRISVGAASSSASSSAQSNIDLWDSLDSVTDIQGGDLAVDQSFLHQSIYVPSTSSHASTSDQANAFGDLIDKFSGKPLRELALDQSIYVPSTSSQASTSAQANAFGDLIDEFSGKPLRELALDQSIYVPSTSSRTFTPIHSSQVERALSTGYQVFNKHGENLVSDDPNQSIRMISVRS